ncbi:MAG: 2-C-methyl-D-erythritol 4-phosphate cytidylyltransferase [Butyrivibrio sp.]|nr:2-C-methyl-D-erythritol 4-phosphate cytidylyltransferase [Butyrivibrio sp.]
MQTNKAKAAAIVLSAGSGSRMKSNIKKQYMEIEGKPLIYYALHVFENSFIDEIVLVTGKDDIDYVQKEIVEKYHFTKVKCIIEGGKQRYHSVCNGLRAVGEEYQYVYIHDGARPFIDDDILQRLQGAVSEYKACVAGMPVKDTIKIADKDGFASSTPNRDLVWMIQTPQVFERELILNSYEELIKNERSLLSQGINITDDAMVLEYFTDVRVKLVEGSYNNIKITTPDDIPAALAFLRKE